ncbi:18652_t:CDS:1, partial [Racocetra persica]
MNMEKATAVVYHQVIQTKLINNEKIVLKKGEAFVEKKQTSEIAKTKQCDIQIEISAMVRI